MIELFYYSVGGNIVDILRLENLSKYYASQSSVVMGLTNINLSFRLGEFVAVTGESGSGKSYMG